MQENATIDKSWDFLVNADEIDLNKVLSALYLIPSSRTKKSQINAYYTFDVKGEDIARKILYLCYESNGNVSYENFIKDIAFAFNKDISREISIEETEAALLEKIKENILKEATTKELELIKTRYNIDYLSTEKDQETDYSENLVRISKLLDINLFTNNDNDFFYNDHPLVAKCYRAVITKSKSKPLRIFSRIWWWLRFYIVDDSDNQTIQTERIEEPFWPMIWRHFKSIARLILVVVFTLAMLPICLILILVIIPFVLFYVIRADKLIEEEKEFEHVQNLKISPVTILSILIVTLIYLRNKKNGTNLKDCIAAIEEIFGNNSKEFVDMSIVAFLYDDVYTNRAIRLDVEKNTFYQVLQGMKKEINPHITDNRKSILTDNIEQTLKILYTSINPERNQYYEKIYNEQTNDSDDPNLSVLMVDYQFPFTRIKENTKFLKCKSDIYDILNRWYLQLMGYDLEDVMIDLKPGDTFDVIQIYDTDRIDTYKDFLSENGKFVVIRTEAEINRGTILSAVSDLQHMLGTPFSRQSGYIDMIRMYDVMNDTEKYKSNVEGLINCVNIIQRIVQYYEGDFPSTIKNAKKEEFPDIAELLGEYVKERESYGKHFFTTTIVAHGSHCQDASIEINRELFFTSLDAIFGNAERHGFSKKFNPGNLIEVYTDLVNYQSTGMVLISIRNNGKPFADGITIDEYIDKGRFSKDSGHLGLGGYHVYSFAKANNGYLNIRKDEEWNVIIDILLPLKNQDININNKYNYDGCR